MSEQNPERQKPKQWFDTCNNCETKYPLTPENTLYVFFEKQQECNYIVCKCMNCGFNTMIFDDAISPNDALARDIEVDDSDRYAGDDVYDCWLQIKGIELPQTYELTERHEKLIQSLGEGILAITTHAPDIFWDEMNSPNSFRPYPQRWI